VGPVIRYNGCVRGCEWCGGRLGVGGARGRMPRFCSTRCRVASHRARRVPAEMVARRRWVSWAPDKRPVMPGGLPASSTDPGTWVSWDGVRSLGRRGFVLGGGIGCIDLDGCLDEAGRLDPVVAHLVPAGTYVEVSPSGRGLHVWGWLPEGRGRRFRVGGVGVEVYSAGRYVTVTGRRWSGAPLVLADLRPVVAGL